jgi:putative transposase
MAENGWAAKRLRAFKRTTIPSDPDKVFADLIGRDFTSGTPVTRLVGDITYLRTGEGWLYLATVIDLCTRMVVGWAMAGHMRASLVTGALTMARDRGTWPQARSSTVTAELRSDSTGRRNTTDFGGGNGQARGLDGRAVGACVDAIAGEAAGMAARASATVLGAGRARGVERGCRGSLRRVAGCGIAAVPARWRDV